MSDATEQALTRAYELIEADQPGEAEQLLKPLLAQEADNADAWWLYAHAVSDPETARMALNQVLKLDSRYEGAQELLDQLEALRPARGAAPERASLSMSPPPNLPEDEDIESPDFLEELDAKPSPVFALDDDFSLDDVEEVDTGPAKSPSKRRIPSVLLILLLLVVVVAAILIVLNPFGTTPSVVTPTQQAAVASATVVQTAATPTQETVTASTVDQESTAESQAADSVEAVQALLADFELAGDSAVELANTSLGNTLIAGVCSANGDAALRETLEAAMPVLAQAHDLVGDDVQAIGVRLVNCTDAATLRIIAMPKDTAAAFINGDVSEEEFRASWIAAA